MVDSEMYDLARQRIDRRNRRWSLWAFNLAGLILSVAALVLLGDTPYATLATAFMLGWVAIFTLHTILVGFADSRDEDIESEVAKLREVSFEKPKRMRLSDDGEITEAAAWDAEDQEKRLRA